MANDDAKSTDNAFDRYFKKVTFYAAGVATIIGAGYALVQVMTSLVFPNAVYVPPLFLIVAAFAAFAFNYFRVAVLNSSYMTSLCVTLVLWIAASMPKLQNLDYGNPTALYLLWCAVAGIYTGLGLVSINTRLQTLKGTISDLQDDVAQLSRWNVLAGTVMLSVLPPSIAKYLEAATEEEKRTFAKTWENMVVQSEALMDVNTRMARYPRP